MGFLQALYCLNSKFDRNKGFEHVQNDLIARRAQYDFSALSRDNGAFLI